MDGLSLSDNVAGLISVAMEVAKTLHSYIGAVKAAPQEANELHAEIVALSKVLDNLVDTLRSDDIDEVNFDQQSILYLVVGACEEHGKAVYKKLGKLRNSEQGGKLMARIAWPCQREDCQQSTQVLHRYTQTLHVLLTASNR
jgi:hypothetical protein